MFSQPRCGYLVCVKPGQARKNMPDQNHSLQMMEIVGLRAGKKGQMVARMGVEGAQNGQSEPEPRRGHVRPHNKYPQERGHQVGENVLNGVAIDGGHGDGCRPFMVLLVNVLVDMFAVEEPTKTHLNFCLFNGGMTNFEF